MFFAAILAGGIGTRLDVGVPKQFYEINEKPLLAYCIEPFLKVEKLDKIIVSSPKEYLDQTNDLVNKYFDGDERIAVIEGGATRNGTILNSIQHALENGADGDSVLTTHDGARIFVTPKLIEDSLTFADQYGASSPVIPATDVIFESKEKGKLNKIPQRKFLVHAQTPQAFKINAFLEIYNDLSEDEIKLLDEAMMLFYLRNKPVHLFEGDASNFKVTRPFDIKIAETLLNME